MNFYVGSDGAILHVDPERVFQGQANACVLRFVGAFGSNMPVTAAFKLPNGVWTTPQSMGLSAVLSGIEDKHGIQFNVWTYIVPEVVTEYYGTVNVQFFVYGDAGSGKAGRIASAISSFEVEKGVPIVLPEPNDDYEALLTQILGALSQLQQADSEGALAAQKSAVKAKEEADKAASSASGANEALLAAVEAATRAKDSETKAKESENNAAANAKHASDSALDSETSAGESATYASESNAHSLEAQGHATDAENSAKWAETQAEYAKSAKEYAEQKANESKNYSQTSAHSADSAQNQATIAYGHATSAAAAASAAETFAERAEAAASETETLYHYRGSVQTYAELPTTGLKVGDVYNVIEKYGDFGAGTNFAWNGEVWDSLGGNFDLSPFIKKTEVSELGKTGKLSDGITDSKHLLVTDGEKSQWNNKQNKLTFDATPTENSQNPVTSGGVAAKLEEYVTKDTDQSISGKKTFKSILLDDPNVSSEMYIEPHRISITGNFQGYDIYYGTDGVNIYYDNQNYQSHYGERYIYYADHVNGGSITLTPLIDSETGDYAPITDDYELYLPLKSGTLARVEDVAEVNEKLKREIDTLYKIGEQAGTYTVTEVEDTYISRETADGLNIVDGAQTPVEEIRGKTVATENLIPYPYIDTDKTDHGVEWTDLGDGRLKAVGETANAFSTYFLSRKNIFVAGNTYTLKDCVVSYKENDVEYYLSSQTSSKTFVWQESWTLVMICVQILRNTVVDRIYMPMINIGSEALAYSPYFPGLKDTYFKSIASMGKNLIPYPYKFMSYVLEGVTITVNADGSVTLNGTATKSAGVNLLSVGIEKLPMGEYTISGGGKSVAVFSYKNGTAWIESNNANSAMTGSIKKGDKISGIGLYVTEGTHYSSVTVYPMFERGNTATAFEPYTSDTLSVEISIELSEYDVAYPEREEVKRQSNTVVLSGTETVEILTNAQGIIEFGVSLPKPSTADLGTINCVSNYFTPTTRTKIWHSEGGELIAATVGFLRILTSRCENNIASFKEFLASLYAAGNPVTVTYKTAEVTTEAVEFNKSSYTAWKNGSESVDQGETDNSEYGAEVAVSQKYYTLAGGTNNEN